MISTRINFTDSLDLWEVFKSTHVDVSHVMFFSNPLADVKFYVCAGLLMFVILFVIWWEWKEQEYNHMDLVFAWL